MEQEKKNLFTCNKSIMGNYGLEGLKSPSPRRHKFCPNIRRNCCSQEDIIKSMDQWISSDRTFIERYYENFLDSIKYILGWVDEVQDLANHFKPIGLHVGNQSKAINKRVLGQIYNDSTSKLNTLINKGDQKNQNKLLIGDKACHKASFDFEQLKISKSLVKADFNSIKSYITKLLEMRKGFYCSICDGESQEKISKNWKVLFPDNQDAPDKFIFGGAFCKEFTDIAIPFVYYIFSILKIYLDSTVTLLVCQKQKLIDMNAEAELNNFNKKVTFENRPVYKVTSKNNEIFLRCEAFKSTRLNVACKDFCKMFDMTSPHEIVDGDINQMKLFVNFIKRNRNLFRNPENNILIKNVEKHENSISMSYNVVFSKKNFFASNGRFGYMDKYNSIIVPGEGINPFQVAADNGYILNIMSVSIIRSFMFIMVILLLNQN
jgi:hypothetical protein